MLGFHDKQSLKIGRGTKIGQGNERKEMYIPIGAI